ncbi:hypothetical protein FACS189472_15170 [Alphaproteobacteria bacterium]|nr:hypothetical protein FACS189472_15170 [Alphaproteobacteria bacterium]
MTELIPGLSNEYDGTIQMRNDRKQAKKRQRDMERQTAGAVANPGVNENVNPSPVVIPSGFKTKDFRNVVGLTLNDKGEDKPSDEDLDEYEKIDDEIIEILHNLNLPTEDGGALEMPQELFELKDRKDSIFSGKTKRKVRIGGKGKEVEEDVDNLVEDGKRLIKGKGKGKDTIAQTKKLEIDIEAINKKIKESMIEMDKKTREVDEKTKEMIQERRLADVQSEAKVASAVDEVRQMKLRMEVDNKSHEIESLIRDINSLKKVKKELEDELAGAVERLNNEIQAANTIQNKIDAKVNALEVSEAKRVAVF